MKYLLIIFAFALAACNPYNYISKHPELFPADSVVITNTKETHDSIYFTKPDSLAIEMLFECDSNNQVLMRELNEIGSKGIKTKIVFKDNKLQINALVDSLEMLNRTIKELSTKETTKINPINIELKKQVEQAQKDNAKLTAKTKSQRKTILSLILVLAGGVLILFVYAKIKKFV